MSSPWAALKGEEQPVTRCIAGPSFSKPLETPEQLYLDRNKSLFSSLALDFNESVATLLAEIHRSKAYQLAGANPGVRKEPNDHLVALIPRHVLQPLELIP
jgi:hypothetical protein